MKLYHCLLVAFLLPASAARPQNVQNLVPYVKPIIGTAKMGHTYPGATVPFGAVQLSPDTDTIPYEMNGKYNPDVYKYCAGYQYGDKTIVGFSHTHFSGTGHSDLGDFLVMPTTGKLQLNPGTASAPQTGYRSVFSHSTEVAEANYYKVRLEDHNITAEMTTTARVGYHQYTFPKSDESHIILDMMSGIYNYDDKNVYTYVRVVNDSLITGYRQTNGWARNRTVYFAMAFSKRFNSYGQRTYDKQQVYRGFWRKWNQTENFPEMAGKQLRLYFNFKTNEGEKLGVKVALSPVSQENAVANMRAETQGWNFEKVKSDGQQLWNKELNKIVVKASPGDLVNFYTAMYHAFITPTIYMDTDGSYKGLDQGAHKAEGFTNYTVFSLWDTFRALHPLFNVIQPSRNSDMIQSMLAHYEQNSMKMLPIWSHYGNENWCMSGYHSVSVIADAIMKGTYKGDAAKALEACVTTARKRDFEGLGYYIDKGYIPIDKNSNAVSTTLEYAYDDWCIARLAKKLGADAICEEFSKRAQNWKNVYDPASNFMRPRLSDGSFRKEFDVLTTNGQGFIEGNAWNFSLYVPQDPAALVATRGGKKKFSTHLDSLFTMHLPDEFFAETEDITRDGIIGNYVHGNEPAHHAAYLYNWTDEPWKTQSRVRMILKKMYAPKEDGLGGNDDCGQMSAWYIFSSLGFYPVAPGSAEYSLGSPAVTSATLNLENGKQFTVEAKDQGEANVYVKKILLNGQPFNKRSISHEDITRGGTLTFFMTNKPVK
ncbi:GH92 family glycosyl hydrolase [Hufsiella ginkgonis]|uniref:Glycoside hydrolase family 92 protein n=1 Tax=Hufsiella ginkgonis TaxID=2695274 RepID=A0A7K1Y2L0_9SPHI|nr:GH92 family glycosyl hydrolase [Hufsiella ginkgonis]MXV17318.1 glycoside hydrolase family 92 protein [Hufsiella ginkgonis]